MARVDTHSRVVAWLKVALPLAALAILATLFLLADRIDPDDALPYADVDVEDRARAPRMTAPTYAGTTSDGAALTLRAAEARPASERTKAIAQGLVLNLVTPDGARTDLTATTAVLDDPSRRILLTGGVEVTTSSGYRITTDGIAANLDRSGLTSSGPVQANGPAGDLVADSMTLSQDNQTPGAYLLVFKGGVKLIYQPGGLAAP
jgi:lipopolysaccharide export system protein LptC